MHESDPEFHRLDALMTAYPPASVPEGFAERAMQRVEAETPAVPVWERPWVQWLAASLGLALTLGRLLTYIFSAWLAVELAG